MPLGFMLEIDRVRADNVKTQYTSISAYVCESHVIHSGCSSRFMVDVGHKSTILRTTNSNGYP